MLTSYFIKITAGGWSLGVPGIQQHSNRQSKSFEPRAIRYLSCELLPIFVRRAAMRPAPFQPDAALPELFFEPLAAFAGSFADTVDPIATNIPAAMTATWDSFASACPLLCFFSILSRNPVSTLPARK